MLQRLVLVLAVVWSLLPGGTVLAAPHQAGSTPISLSDYWNLVEHTRQVLADLSSMSEETVRPALDELVAQWQAVQQVELEDGGLMTVDNSALIQALQSGNKANLPMIKSMVDALLEAHRQQPKELFTSADLNKLQNILADPQFQWKEQENPIGKWLDELWLRFQRWLAGLFGNPEPIQGGQVATVTFDVVPFLTALLLMVVLAYVFRSVFVDLAAESRLGEDMDANSEPITAEQAFARAQSLSRGGDYRSAVRYLYLSSLLLLDERGLLRYDRSKTNHEYLRSVEGQPELAKSLREVIDVFDNTWYGYHTLDEDSFKHYSDHVEELKEKKSS